MKIQGKYETDENFTTVYSGNRIYTIARTTGEWSSVGVGERTYTGHVLDQETYNKLAAGCTKDGAFTITSESN